MAENKKKIIVGMSGGVDSSLAALLLKEEGCDVIGVTMAIRDKTERSRTLSGRGCYDCDREKIVEAARDVCARIGIPYYAFDCSEEYKTYVLDYFRNEYMAGRTPNPCVRCNHFMKFGVLTEAAKKHGLSFDFFATGHYARMSLENGRPVLRKGVDAKKDQSYFLYRLTPAQAAGTIFPLGGYTKAEVRSLAKRFGLAVHDKPDSQDFYSGDYADLLDVEPREGRIILPDGKTLGKHKGFWNYTVGQRKGLGIAYPEPLYVIAVNAEKNEVVVAPERDTLKRRCSADSLNWMAPAPATGEILTAKLRSSQPDQEIRIIGINDGILEAEFAEPQKAITPGQSLVLYRKDIVVGGGIIRKDPL